MTGPNTGPVDWHRARAVATALAPAGPAVDRTELVGIVARLRAHAAAAPEHVADVTGLTGAAAAAAGFDRLIVDRPRWAGANIESFSTALTAELPPVSALGRGAAGAEIGAALALLSTRVLGQFDPFTRRLFVVAPNIVQVHRALGVDESDFGLWVCLHEQTHAVQFAAAPWLADHLGTAMNELVSSMAHDPSDRLGDLLRSLPDLLRERPATPSSGGALLGAVLTAEEEERMAEVMAVMSLLEGHADVVMDAVGPGVVPTVARIRRVFNRRRDRPGRVDRVVRRLLGMDAKLEQYRAGAAFVRAVTRRVGHDGFNAVFTGAEYLPTAAEVAAPRTWVRRVHG
ncbi:hypothetical protein GCG21_00045 [Pseudactinotalea sp. HY160]|uniref:zinc-dependent metalloprotease n=1 Tax=Pseudactinotalea sp. HY160 TaxID=2654490 RepID=UPI001310A996|nr:hypothetical protein [Pseudactinotalea sp. HY160]